MLNIVSLLFHYWHMPHPPRASPVQLQCKLDVHAVSSAGAPNSSKLQHARAASSLLHTLLAYSMPTVRHHYPYLLPFHVSIHSCYLLTHCCCALHCSRCCHQHRTL